MLQRLDRIEKKLDDLAKQVFSTPLCPHPGLCVELSHTLARTIKSVEDSQRRILRLENRYAWLAGAATIAMILVTLFGPSIRAALHLP